MDSLKETAMAVATPMTPTWKYSNRVLLKTIIESGDGGLGLVNERVVIGGWVKSSKEVKKEPVAVPPPSSDVHGASAAASGPKPKATETETETEKEKDVSCVEILQSRIPFFRTIIKVLGGTSGVANNVPIREKLEALVPKPPPPSTVFLQVSDGSCVSSLQVQ